MAIPVAKKKDRIAVSRIEIEIGRKVISLTPEEMRELRDILDATFPKEKIKYIPSAPIVIEKPVYPSYPYQRWKEPTWLDTPIVTCDQRKSHEYTMRLTCNQAS
jgi:hypothetical protein